MKKLLILVASLLIAVSAHAQFGVIAGITSSSSDMKTAIGEVRNVNQYHAGITYKLGFGNFFAVQPSLIYNMKGAKLADIAGSGELDYKTGYVELPLQFQAGFGFGDIFRIYGLAEPFVGYAISNTISGGEKATAQQTWDNIKSKAEYGFSLGAGVELIKHVQVSVKYFWNLGKVYGTETKLSDINIGEGNCNGIAASVAILF
jgi:hypothetical protein